MKTPLMLALLCVCACGTDKAFDGANFVNVRNPATLWAEVGDVGAEIVHSGTIFADGTPEWAVAQGLHDVGVQIVMSDNDTVGCGGEAVAACTHHYSGGSIEIESVRGRCDIAGPLGSHELLHVALLQATGDGDAGHGQPDVWGEVGLEGHLQAFVGGLCAQFPE